MDINTHFAQLLHQSRLDTEVKEWILEHLKEMSQEEISALYHLFLEEDERRKKGILQMDLEAEGIIKEMKNIGQKGQK